MKKSTLLKIIRAGIYIALITPLVYIPGTVFPAIMGKSIFFQIIIEIVLPFFIYLLITCKEMRFKFSLLTKLILLFFVAIFVSSLFGADFAKSFWGYDERMRGLFSMLHFLLLYFYIITVFKDAKDKKKLLTIVIGVGVLCSFYGILDRIIPDLRADKSIVVNDVDYNRVNGSFGNPIFLAGYLTFIFFISLYYVIIYKEKSRWLGVAGMLFSFAALMYTGTRGAFLAIVGGIGLFLFLRFIFADKKQKKIFGAILISLILLFVFFITVDINIIKNNKYIGVDRIFDLSLKKELTSQRVMIWQVALKSFTQHPILGWGVENFDYAFDANYDVRLLRFNISQIFVDRAHNIFLDWLVMTGLVGLSLYLSIFIIIFIQIFKKEFFDINNLLILSLFSSFLIYSLFELDSPSINLMLFFSFAMAEMILFNREIIIEENKKIPIKYSLIIILIILIFYTVYTYNIRPIYSGINFIKFKHSGSIEDRKQLADKFLNPVSPYKDNLRVRFANLVFLETADPNVDRQYIGWALDRSIQETKISFDEHQNDFSYPFLLGNLYLIRATTLKDASLETAIDFYKQALKLSPKRQATIFQLATSYLFNNEHQKAINLLEEIVILDDKSGQPFWRLGVAYLANKEEEKAYGAFRKALDLNFVESVLQEIKQVAVLCSEREDYQCLSVIYTAILSQEPDNIDLRAQLASIYIKLKLYNKAREEAIKLLELDPSLKEEVNYFLQSLEVL